MSNYLNRDKKLLTCAFEFPKRELHLCWMLLFNYLTLCRGMRFEADQVQWGEDAIEMIESDHDEIQ